MLLQAALRQQHELQALYDLRRVFLVVVAAGLAASCVMGWIAARRVLHPLDRMTRTAQNIAAGNFDERVVLSSEDAELDRLANAFNAMLDRIQSFVLELREMNDSIAHDLTLRPCPNTTCGGPARGNAPALRRARISGRRRYRECDRTARPPRHDHGFVRTQYGPRKTSKRNNSTRAVAGRSRGTLRDACRRKRDRAGCYL